MKPTADIEEKGLKAYEQARAFERLRSWRLPISYAVLIAVPVIGGLAALAIEHFLAAIIQFGLAILFAVGAGFHWVNLTGRYARNRELVANLEATYGNELPWVKVNRHFAELQKLEEELARERQAGKSD